MFFPEKHPKIPKWGKNLVKNACLLCSRNLLSNFSELLLDDSSK